MTPLAHAVRFAIRCGIESVEDLSRELECTPSAIYRAKKQLKDSDPTVKKSDRTVKSDRTELTERSLKITGTLPALNTESTNVDTLLARKGGVGGFEIEGLNGSTGPLVQQLACMLAGPMGNPDFLTAREILASNVAAFGPEKLKAGFAEWHTKALTKQISPTPRSLVGFIKNARTHAKPNQTEYDNTSMDDAWDAFVASEAAVQ